MNNMSAKQHSMRYALLVTALMQVFPSFADSAKQEKAEAAPECEDCPDYSGKTGWVELGIGAQSDDSAHFGRYSGHAENGAYLNASGEYRYRGKDNGGYLDLKVEEAGLDTREVVLESGRQGKYDIAVEYDQIPNVRALDTQTPFHTSGGGQLDLPAGWVAGSTTSTMPTLATDLATSSLKTRRDSLGVKFSMHSGKNWEVSGHFRREEKDGTRDVGATIGFSQTAILPAPVNYQTDDFGLTLGYQGERLQGRLAYQGSLFKNDYARIGWENPFAAFPTSPAGQIAEAPDNQFHQMSAVLGYQLSDKTRLGAKFSRGRVTQDEALMPYSVNASIATTALPTGSLDGEVDTTLAKVEINSRPSTRLRLDASYTFSDRDNKTLVNTYDYVVADVFAGGLRQNRPYSYEQKLWRAKAGYRVSGDTDVSFGLDHDTMQRTYQQVEETEDLNLWARLKMRPTEMVETTFKLAHANRDASDYLPQAGEHSLMRVHNLADRERDKAGFEVNFSPNEKLSLGADLEYLKDDYSNMYLGLREANGMSTNLNLTYAFSERLTATTYYSKERLDSDQAGSEWSIPAIETPWLASTSNHTDTFGVGFNWVAIPKKLDLGVDYVYADYTGKMNYVGTTPLPDLSATLSGITLHGAYKMKENLTVRVTYQYERYQESDWAKTGAVDAVPTLLTLGEAAENTKTHLITVSMRYTFK
jgi:MtrB/PioB family decaheme-associated outer membrane protein